MTRIHLDKLVREKKNAEYGISDARKFIKPLELFVIWRKLKVSYPIYTFSKSCHRHLSRFENSSKLFACAYPEFFNCFFIYACYFCSCKTKLKIIWWSVRKVRKPQNRTKNNKKPQYRNEIYRNTETAGCPRQDLQSFYPIKIRPAVYSNVKWDRKSVV